MVVHIRSDCHLLDSQNDLSALYFTPHYFLCFIIPYGRLFCSRNIAIKKGKEPKRLTNFPSGKLVSRFGYASAANKGNESQLYVIHVF
jgi:hypothetical protein